MGLYLVFLKTLKDMLGVKRNLAFVILGVAIPVLIISMNWGSRTSPYDSQSLSMITQSVVDSYMVIWYVWGAGILLAVMVSASAAGFISKEVTDGTLMLVAAKPVNRWQIIAGKFAALLLNSMLLLAINHLLAVLLLRAIAGMDMDIIEVLLGLTPYLLLYAFIVALFFGAISVALSALINSRVKIVVIAMLLVVITFFSSIFLQFWHPSYNTRKIISYFSPSCHTNITYSLIHNSVPFWEISPGEQGTLNGFSGTPTGDDPFYSTYFSSYTTRSATPIHPVVSLMTLLAISSGAIALSIWALNRKQM